MDYQMWTWRCGARIADRARHTVHARWKGRGAYGDELSAIYSFSKINLGLLSEAGSGVEVGNRPLA